MKNIKKKAITIIILICLALITYYGYSYHMFMKKLSRSIVMAGPVAKVNLEGWKQMKKGLSKKDVERLLGDSAAKRSLRINNEPYEFWEYNYKGAIIEGPHPYAYIVFFNVSGKVESFREPLEKKTDGNNRGNARE